MVLIYVIKDGNDPTVKTVIMTVTHNCVKSPEMFKNKMF